jgi:hypothetical protein
LPGGPGSSKCFGGLPEEPPPFGNHSGGADFRHIVELSGKNAEILDLEL